MVLSVCESCGTKLGSGTIVCPLCGATPPAEERDFADDGGANNTSSAVLRTFWTLYPTGSDVFYHTTRVLLVGYITFVVFGMITKNFNFLILGTMLAAASLVTLYLDLIGLSIQLYKIRPVLWVIGTALLYFLVMPLYVHKRQRIERLSDEE